MPHRFNPRTRVGCDDQRHPERCPVDGFNPRTRVGCDCPCQPFSAAGKSFNPRTRVGCDVGQQPVATVALVSIHAPAWGATGVNLRTCKHHEKVSIHAPAWGATHAINTGLSFLVLFQSTHPRGVRQARHRWHLLLSAFQSTHPRGVRPAGRVPDQHALIGFNPRTRVGCDLLITET